MIQLHFTTSASLVSATIRAFTWSPYSHVEFTIPPGYFKDYPEGGYLGSQQGDGGVKLRPFNYDKSLSAELFGTVDCDVETEKKVLQFAYDQIGKKYDSTALWGLVIHDDLTTRESWFCSELVCAAFIEAEHPLLNISKVNRITPGMVLISPLIQYNTPTGFPLRRIA